MCIGVACARIKGLPHVYSCYMHPRRAYLMWSGQQPGFQSLLPLVRKIAWTDYAFFKTRGDRDGIWRYQMQWQ